MVITLGPRFGLEPRPDPGSYSPHALRPPSSLRPAARASSARHRPATRPSAVAPPRPAPSGCPAPTASSASRSPADPARTGVRPGVHVRTWTAGVCVRGRASGYVPSPSLPEYPEQGPQPLSRPSRAVGGRDGAILGPAPGGRGGRSLLPQPTPGWRQPRAGLVRCGVTTAGRGEALGQFEAAQALAKPGLQSLSARRLSFPISKIGLRLCLPDSGAENIH